jgi:hypothetical protein
LKAVGSVAFLAQCQVLIRAEFVVLSCVCEGRLWAGANPRFGFRRIGIRGPVRQLVCRGEIPCLANHHLAHRLRIQGPHPDGIPETGVKLYPGDLAECTERR